MQTHPEMNFIMLIHSYNPWHMVAAIDYRGIGTVETGGKLKAVFRCRQPVLKLLWITRLVMLNVNYKLSVFGMQLAALQHKTVERVAVERIIVKVPFLIVKRHFPEFAYWRHVIQIEGDCVFVLARKRLAFRILHAK